MTRRFICLRAASGDAPGYIREALTEVATLGTLVANSDLFAVRSRECARPWRYHLLAELDSDLALAQLRRGLHGLERRLAAQTRPHGGRGPIACELLDGERLMTMPRAAMARANAIAQALCPAATRIAGTARLRAPRALDYDEPDGAGAGYDTLRPLTGFGRAMFDAASRAIRVRPGSRVLDVGCGTGRFTTLLARAGARTVGLDRSATMLAAARRHGSEPSLSIEYVRRDASRRLPGGPYDAIVFFMSIHYLALTAGWWRSLRAALAPGGRVAIVTLAQRHFIENEFLTPYFPSIPRIDLARFPSIPSLIRALRRASFSGVAVHEVRSHTRSSAADLIQRVEGRYVSTLHLLGDDELAAGVAAMRRDLRARSTVRRCIHATVVSARG